MFSRLLSSLALLILNYIVESTIFAGLKSIKNIPKISYSFLFLKDFSRMISCSSQNQATTNMRNIVTDEGKTQELNVLSSYIDTLLGVLDVGSIG
jgi:hypothetical protein